MPSIALSEGHQHVVGTGTGGTGLHRGVAAAPFAVEGLGMSDFAGCGKCPGSRQRIEVLDPQRLLRGIDHPAANRQKTLAVV